MKPLDEIRAFGEALPGASYFATTFPNGIAAAEVAHVDARTVEQAT